MEQPRGESLQVSIIEAKNILCNESEASTSKLYVRVTLGASQTVSDLITAQPKGSLKFLKTARVPIPADRPKSLLLELVQKNTSGEAVLGGLPIPVSDLIGRPTFNNWVQLKNGDQKVTADLFVALRHSTGLSPPSSPMSSVHPVATPSPEAAPVAAKSKGKGKTKGKSGGKGSKDGLSAFPLMASAAVVAVTAMFLKPQPRVYEVQEGDTLCEIGACYGKDYNCIFKCNRDVLDDPNLIYPGDRLRIA